ncbi:MAG TPA: hypothetical protein VJ875_15275 [Pyrinomonadaceae bacterium]|nr:hypothetical protein [Pyrinomonadaceae bacterium]
MKTLMITMIVLISLPSLARSQSQEPPKFEVAAEFTTLERDATFEQRTEPGFGGRFTLNLNKVFSLETAGYFFPKRCFTCNNNGRVTEVLGGVKVSKRFEKWGIFAKARPGVISFSKGEFNVIEVPSSPSFPFVFKVDRLNSFATDIGGGLEFYPSRRIVTRFDAGDTIIHFKQRLVNMIAFDPLTNTFILQPAILPARTTHNFQFIASVGFRF